MPTFVEDMFWVGMSTMQRSESMNAFFDKYINKKITLKQFFEQYESALAAKVHNETVEDFNFFNSRISCIIIYDMEKQFQSAYTLKKIIDFQNEIVGSICCSLSSCREHDNFSKYEVREDVSREEGQRSVIFHVYFNEDNSEVNCK